MKKRVSGLSLNCCRKSPEGDKLTSSSESLQMRDEEVNVPDFSVSPYSFPHIFSVFSGRGIEAQEVQDRPGQEAQRHCGRHAGHQRRGAPQSQRAESGVSGQSDSHPIKANGIKVILQKLIVQ